MTANAEENILRIEAEGEYQLFVETSPGNFQGLLFSGYFVTIDNPKVGRIIQSPFGELLKIIRIGTRFVPYDKTKQFKVVYAKEWDGK